MVALYRNRKYKEVWILLLLKQKNHNSITKVYTEQQNITYHTEQSQNNEHRKEYKNMEKEQALNIVYKPIKELKPYKKNAKKHPKEQVERIANSIKEFGFTQPVIVDKNNI